MNIITKENIDKWLFDYFEGNLTFHEQKEVEQFIKNHPEFKDDFDAWSQTTVEETPVFYNGVNSLQKASFVQRNKSLLLLALLLLLVSGSGIGYYLTNKDQIAHKDSIVSLNQSISETNDNQKGVFEDISNTQQSPIISSNYQEEGASDSKKTSNQGSIIINGREELKNNITKDQIISPTSTSNYNYVSRWQNKTSKKVKQSKSADTYELDNVKGFIGSGDYDGLTSTSDDNNSQERKHIYLHRYQSTRIDATDGNRSDFSYQHISRNKQRRDRGSKNKSTKKYNSINDVNYSKSSNNKSLAKHIVRFFEKDLALTVYNNRVTMDNNLSTLQAFDGFAGSISKPRFQLGSKVTPGNELILNNYLSADFRIKKFGFGVLMTNYSKNITQNNSLFVEPLNRNNITVTSNYQLDLGKFKVSPFITTKIGFAEMSLPSYLDSSLTLNKIPKNQTGINFNTGFSLELPFMYLGFQANNLYALADNSNRQNSYFGPVSYRIVAGTDYRKFITTDVLVSPQIYTDIINGRVENNFALTSRYKGFLSGASYSTTNDAKLMVGMDVKRLRVGYSVSANTTNFDVISHEVGIQYIFSKRSSGYLVY